MGWLKAKTGKSLGGWIKGAPTDVKNIYDTVTPWETNREFETRRRETEESAWGSVEDIMSGRGNYEIPSEYQQYYETQAEAAEDIRGLSKQQLNIAQRQVEMGMPGYEIAKSQIGQSTAGALRAVQEAGGGIASLGAISDLYQGELEQLQNLASQQAQYKAAGLQNLQSAYGTAAGQEATAAQIMGQGQLALGQQQQQAYQLNVLDPYYDQLNLATTKAGYDIGTLQGQDLARQERRSALAQTGLGIIGNLAAQSLSGG
jgi:hypothetical protein